MIKDDILFFDNWLENMCHKINEKTYYINQDKFNSFKYKGELDIYINELKPYYKNKDYLKDVDYKKCMTICRQICKTKKYKFEYKIKYVKSKYYIEYYFFFFVPIILGFSFDFIISSVE